MIQSFKNRNVAKIVFWLEKGAKIPKQIAKEFDPKLIEKAKRLLVIISDLEDPKNLYKVAVGSRPKKLTNHPIYNNHWSLRIDSVWRICFIWGADVGLDNNAYEVEINKHYGDKNS